MNTGVRSGLLVVAMSLVLGAAAYGDDQCMAQPTGQKAEHEDGHLVVYYRMVPPEPAIGEFFALDILVCSDDSLWEGELKADATMPAHGHGMNYRPEVNPIGKGSYWAEGFLFHMPGSWRLEFALDEAGQTQRIQTFIDVN